jgi:CubicO group peptidase (beta-lactamase class C family)
LAIEETALALIDAAVERAVEQRHVPGVVAAVAWGDDVHVATAGRMAFDGAPMRRDTLFRITSMTKPMTAAVILSLVDGGLLTLEGSIDELLPELANRRVMVRPDGALFHTDGTPDPPPVVRAPNIALTVH